MASSNFYPIFLSLQGANCLIVGLGSVGLRKLKGILSANPASVLILDKRPANELESGAQNLLKLRNVVFQNREWTLSDIRNSFIVFAATNDPVENARIARVSAEENTLCDCATDAGNGSFIVPAIARNEDLMAAVSTFGSSPAFAKKLRLELEKWLEPRARFSAFLGRLRPLAFRRLEASRRPVFFRDALGLEDWFLSGKLDKCREWIMKNLPSASKHEVEEIFKKS